MGRLNPRSVIYRLLLISVLASSIYSCTPSHKLTEGFVYFQGGVDTAATVVKETIIQRFDLLGIRVFSGTLNQEQVAIFNQRANQQNDYQVNMNGNVELPLIGEVSAAGLTTRQLQDSLVQKLSNTVKNPTVSVRFLQFRVNVLGEVRTPGAHKFDVDKVTLIDAIGAAGDLTDYAKRDDITVIREENGKKSNYRVDIRSTNLFQSPAYLLQPNDIVYVSPNKYKLKKLNSDAEGQSRSRLVFTLFTALVSAANLIVNAAR